MNKTLKAGISAGNPCGRKPTKEEFLRLLHTLDPLRSSHSAINGPGKIPPAKSAKRFTREARSLETIRLLRKHFVLQVAQMTGIAG